MSQKQVDRIKSKLRILEPFEIVFDAASEYRGQCSFDCDCLKATIYSFGEDDPRDYILHELLHVAFARLRQLQEQDYEFGRAAEEELIQDICWLMEIGC